MNKTTLASYAEPVARKLAQEMGYELVDAELAKENTGRHLRFTIDKPGGVTLDDCEAYHRALLPKMEIIDYDYMEVSSPGVDRPLKTERDFASAEGARVEARLYRPVDGKKAYVGTLIGLRDDRIVIEEGGVERAFDRKLVSRVAPVIEFDEEELAAALEDE